jgi:hypothetical protein
MIVEMGNISQVVVGAANLLVSVAETEVLGDADILYKNFHFIPDALCHISINGGNYFYVRANQEITIDKVKSLKIKEAGINFTWYATKG